MRLIDFATHPHISKQDWTMYDLTSNPNITMNDIMSHQNMNWCMYGILANSSLTLNDIETIYSKFWNYSLEQMLQRSIRFQMNLKKPEIFLSMNQSVPLQWFMQNKEHIRWSYYELARHREMTIDVMEANYQLFRPVSMRVLSNPHIPLDYILNYIQQHRNENTMLLSTHPEITIDHIVNTPWIRWHFPTLSYHTNITPEIVRQYPDLSWYTYHYFKNPNFTIDDLRQHLEPHVFNQYAVYYSKNPNISMQLVCDNPEFPWNDTLLSSNPSIRPIDIINHLDRAWNYNYIMKNRFEWSPIEYTQQTLPMRMKQTHQHLEHYKDELIGRAWSPERMQKWCLDIEEYQDIYERWSGVNYA